MGSARLALALAVLAVVSAGAVALAAWDRGASSTGASDVFDVRIVGPANATLFSGLVQVENATALSALRAACEKGNVSLEVETFPGMGAYVRSIGGHRGHGGAGWIYEVTRPEGSTVSGDRTAASFALHKGEALRWRWVEP